MRGVRADGAAAQEGDLEGYGLVYFEAAASGRAVVAGRSGGEVDAVVDGETGVLVDGTSVPEVAAALNDLLGDPARAARLGVAAATRGDHAQLGRGGARGG